MISSNKDAMVKVTRREADYYGLETETLWLPLDRVAACNTRSGEVATGYGQIQGRWFDLVNHHNGGNPSHIIAELCQCRNPQTEHHADHIVGCELCDHTGIRRNQPPTEPHRPRREQLIESLRPKATS